MVGAWKALTGGDFSLFGVDGGRRPEHQRHHGRVEIVQGYQVGGSGEKGEIFGWVVASEVEDALGATSLAMPGSSAW